MASYSVNAAGVAHARELIAARQYVLRSEWGEHTKARFAFGFGDFRRLHRVRA